MAMKLKSLFSTTGLSLLSFTVFAQHQSPDQSIGKKSKILSLSNGKYDESFYKDSLERVGTVLINRYTRKIESLLQGMPPNKIDDLEQSRFLSVDPVTSNFPEYSPYQYAANTPIQAIDLDGLEDYVVVKELFRSGATKNISIQYAVTKDDNQTLVNSHFREALGKSSNGSQKLGNYLTDQSVIRIVRDANGQETGQPDNVLTKQEQAIVDKRVHDEGDLPPDDNQWTLTIGKKLYISETARDATKVTDKIAERGFRGRVPKFDDVPLQPGSVVSNFNGSNNYFYGVATLPNGGQLGNDLTASLNSLADQLKNADNVTSVTLNLNQAVNVAAGTQEYSTANQYGADALSNAVNLLKTRLKGTNITVNLGTVNTAANSTIADQIKAGKPSGVSATIQ
jgi:hypothetical protein